MNSVRSMRPIVAWKQLGERCNQYLEKGQSALVEGRRLAIREYETSEGEKRKGVEVVASDVQFLGGGRTTQQRGGFDDEPAF
jgi:single-strand DNA-binding protein